MVMAVGAGLATIFQQEETSQYYIKLSDLNTSLNFIDVHPSTYPTSLDTDFIQEMWQSAFGDSPPNGVISGKINDIEMTDDIVVTFGLPEYNVITNQLLFPVNLIQGSLVETNLTEVSLYIDSIWPSTWFSGKHKKHANALMAACGGAGLASSLGCAAFSAGTLVPACLLLGPVVAAGCVGLSYDFDPSIPSNAFEGRISEHIDDKYPLHTNLYTSSSLNAGLGVTYDNKIKQGEWLINTPNDEWGKANEHFYEPHTCSSGSH